MRQYPRQTVSADKRSARIGVQLRPLFFHDLAPYSSHPSLTTRRCKSGSHCQQANLERHVIRVSISRILNDRLTNGFRAEVFNLSSSNHRIIVYAQTSSVLLAGFHLVLDEPRQSVYLAVGAGVDIERTFRVEQVAIVPFGSGEAP